MLFIPIDQIDIFGNERTKYGTELSLHIDGVTINSILVYGKGKPSSGVKTVGAFKSENKETLVAWIDPVSGSLFDAGGSGEKFFAIAAFLLFMLLFFLAIRAGWLYSGRTFLIPIAIFIAVLAALSVRAMRRWKLMDQKLRAALKNLP